MTTPHQRVRNRPLEWLTAETHAFASPPFRVQYARAPVPGIMVVGIDVRAIEIRTPGGPDVLVETERPKPSPAAGEVLVKVAAAGVNRPDVMQRMGHYPPPSGITDIPGLEIAGVVEQLGPGVDNWRAGDRVCALLAGGGYAEYCVAP